MAQQVQQGMNPTVTDIARNFVQNYYGTLDKIENRPNLAAVYRENTNLKFGEDSFIGTQAIMQKLMALPGNMARIYSAIDAVPLDGYLLVNVLGQQKENAYKSPKEDVYSIDLKPLQTDQENDHPLAFTHTFVLSQDGSNIVIVIEIFRLVLHDV